MSVQQNAENKPTTEQQDLKGPLEAARDTLLWIKWLKARVYELIDRDEIRKDRDAARAVHTEQARKLKVETDFASQRQQLEFADKTSQIQARRVLCLQRLKNIFIELRKEAPEVMLGVSFPEFLKSSESFVTGVYSGTGATEGNFLLIEAPVEASGS